MLDVSHLEKIGRELSCPICLSLIDSAVTITCNHAFCKACILKSMKSDSSCPVCKVPSRPREVRAAPHLDSLVSIYKGMEIDSGVKIFVSQNMNAVNKPSEEKKHVEASSKCTHEAINGSSQDLENQRSSKRKRITKVKESISDPSGPIVLKPSSQTKKRVLVPKHPSPVISRSVNSVGNVGNSQDGAENCLTDLIEQPALSKDKLVFSPFFWLREEEEEEENPSQLAESDHLLYSTPPDVPCFSDLKDSDVESPSKVEEQKKSEAMEVFDSEMIELTQRPSSPDLFPCPTKISAFQVPDSEDIDVVQETLSSATSEGSMNAEDKAEDAKNKDWYSVPQLSQNKLNDSVARQVAHEKGISVYTRKARTRSRRNCSNTFEAEATGGKDILPLGAELSIDEEKEINRSLNPQSVKQFAAQDPNINRIEESLNASSYSSEDYSRRSNKKKSKFASRSNQNELLNAKKRAGRCTGSSANGMENPEPKENSRTLAQRLNSDSTSKRITRPRHNKSMRSLADDTTSHELICDHHVGGAQSSVSINQSLRKPNLANGFAIHKCETLANKFQCAFCHSSEDSEASGEMAHYYKGVPVSADYKGGSMVTHSHRNCTEWAPNVYFEGDVAINLEAELTRSRRITCSCCGLKGAALGCYEKSCKKSFHVSCARLTAQCRWDSDNFVMLCPLHAHSKLPGEETKHKGTSRKCSTIGQMHVQRNLVAGKRNVSIAQSKNTNGSFGKLVLCCSGLAPNEKEVILEFSKGSGVRVARLWEPSVTHVIASTDDRGACKRTLKVLMGILEGKWILNIEWVKACMKNMEHVDEEQFEITMDVHGIRDGPRAGRLRALNKEAKLFDGLNFYLMGNFEPTYKRYLQDLVVAAGGTVLHRRPISRPESHSSTQPSTSTFIVYSAELPENCDSSQSKTILSRRQSDAAGLAGSAGARAVSNSWVLSSVAAAKLQSH